MNVQLALGLIASVVCAALFIKAGRQAAWRKGRSPNWAFCFLFPPTILLLELLPSLHKLYPGETYKSKPSISEWLACSLVVLMLVLIAVGFAEAFLGGAFSNHR